MVEPKSWRKSLDSVGATLHGIKNCLSGEKAMKNISFLAKGELPLV